jgi:hypothetical protein
MKKVWLMLSVLLMLSAALPAQIDKMRGVLEDEMDHDNYTLRFLDALDGKPIAGAAVTIDDKAQFTTDHEGKIKFPKDFNDGNLVVRFTAEGYISTTITIEVIAGTIFNNRISVSPEMAMEWVRIILDWGRSPKDLDAHFEKNGSYHVSFRNMKTASDGTCRLDRDDTSGFGPETITVEKIETEGKYTYWVHDYTNLTNDNSRHLSRSGATVKVYGNGTLQGYYTVPSGQRGNVWKVFEIKNGQFETINQVTSHSSR